MITVISGAMLCEGSLVLVRKGPRWILPGGKRKQRETDIGCLCREVGEELSGTKVRVGRYFGNFVDPTALGDGLNVKVYLTELDGPLGAPSGEISEVLLLDPARECRLPKITSNIVGRLRRSGYFYGPS